MSWEILLGISIASSVAQTLVSRVLMKSEDGDPVAFSVIANLTAGILLTIFAFIKGFSTANIQTVIPNLILMAILYGAMNIFMFRSLKLTGASEFTILFTTRVLWSIVAAIIFLHETFLPKQFLGTTLIVLGIIIVSFQSNKFKIGKGGFYALLAAATIGIEFINDAVILKSVDVFFYMPLIFIIPNLLIWIVFPKSTRKILSIVTSRSVLKVLLLGGFFAISATTYLMAYQVGRNAAQIASLNQIQTILTVIAATIILKERKDYLKKILASFFAFIGAILVK